MDETVKLGSDSDYSTRCPSDYANYSLESFSILCTNTRPDKWNNTETFYACCYPAQIYNLSTFAGIWCIIVAILGASGNLLTLATIPWASRNKLFGLEKCWNNATIFVLNLALADFLYCFIDLPTYSLQYLSKYWPWGDSFCKLNAAARYIGAFSAWMSLGMVAISRCASLTHPKAFKRICRGNRGYMIIATIWLYGFLMVLLPLTKTFGMFGYNKNIGKCDFIRLETDPVNPHTVFYGIAFLLPFTAVTVSYSIIWKTSRNSTTYLKRYSCEENKHQLQQRDLRMTWTILVLSLCFVFTVGPISLMNVIDATMNKPQIHLAFFMIYWFQYSFNFFIYAARSEQYRKAYCCFIRCFLLRGSCSEHKIQLVSHNSIFYIDTSNYENLDLDEFLERMNLHGGPKPKVVAFQNEGFNVSIDYSMDLKVDKSTVSYSGNVQLNKSSAANGAIITLPGQLNQTKIVSSQQSVNSGKMKKSAKISTKKYRTNWSRQMSDRDCYSYDHYSFDHKSHDHYSFDHNTDNSCDYYSNPDAQDSCSHDFIKSTDKYCNLEGEHEHKQRYTSKTLLKKDGIVCKRALYRRRSF